MMLAGNAIPVFGDGSTRALYVCGNIVQGIRAAMLYDATPYR